MSSEQYACPPNSWHILPDKGQHPQEIQRCFAVSAAFFIGLMEDGRTVVKYPRDSSDPDFFRVLRHEQTCYLQIGPHPSIVTYLGLSDTGLLLEYCEAGDLEGNITAGLSNTIKSKISRQITEGLAHLHANNFIHCDMHVRNIFMTPRLDAKIGDLQGQLSGADGEVVLPSLAQENAKSRHPDAGDDEFSPRTDIFALGTVLYHLWHGHPPFPEVDEFADREVIETEYRRGNFPIAPQAEGIDAVIDKCWRSTYSSASDVLLDLRRL